MTITILYYEICYRILNLTSYGVIRYTQYKINLIIAVAFMLGGCFFRLVIAAHA